MKWVSTNPSLGAGKSSPAMAGPPGLVRLPRRLWSPVRPVRWILLLRRTLVGLVHGRWLPSRRRSRRSSMSAFGGFPPETISFLRELRVNNRREWLDAHRDDYEAYWLGPAKAFVVAAGRLLAELAPQIRAEPRVLGSILRINRDSRFSRDPSPYKDHLDVWFWEGERRRAVSGFFARLTP